MHLVVVGATLAAAPATMLLVPAVSATSTTTLTWPAQQIAGALDITGEVPMVVQTVPSVLERHTTAEESMKYVLLAVASELEAQRLIEDVTEHPGEPLRTPRWGNAVHATLTAQRAPYRDTGDGAVAREVLA
jgi:hypothetical protein